MTSAMREAVALPSLALSHSAVRCRTILMPPPLLERGRGRGGCCSSRSPAGRTLAPAPPAALRLARFQAGNAASVSSVLISAMASCSARVSPADRPSSSSPALRLARFNKQLGHVALAVARGSSPRPAPGSCRRSRRPAARARPLPCDRPVAKDADHDRLAPSRDPRPEAQGEAVPEEDRADRLHRVLPRGVGGLHLPASRRSPRRARPAPAAFAASGSGPRRTSARPRARARARRSPRRGPAGPDRRPDRPATAP